MRERERERAREREREFDCEKPQRKPSTWTTTKYDKSIPGENVCTENYVLY